jgi:hypothetical protein
VTVFVPASPFGFTIFCDDVRQENNGKFFFVGVYTTELIIFGQAPMLLPTFATFINYLERPGESVDPVKLKIFIPGLAEPFWEVDLDVAPMRNTPLSPPMEGEDRAIRMSIPLKFSPFPINGEGLIKVRAYRGNDEIRLGTIAVKFQPPPMNTIQPVTPG